MPQFASLGGITIRLNIAPFLRVDGRGDIFFAPLLARLYSDSITLTALVASSFRSGGSGDFSLSPFPLMRVLSCLRASINPPPPGRGMCERAVDLRLRAGCRFACFSSCRVALSLALVRYCLACGSGFHSPARLVFPICLVGSRSPASSPVLSLFPVFPVQCVSYCVLASRPVLSVGFGLIVAPCVSSSLLGSYPVSPFPAPIVGLLVSPISVSWRPRGGLASFRPSPRLACRRTGRLAVWVPIVSGGSLL